MDQLTLPEVLNLEGTLPRIGDAGNNDLRYFLSQRTQRKAHEDSSDHIPPCGRNGGTQDLQYFYLGI